MCKFGKHFNVICCKHASRAASAPLTSKWLGHASLCKRHCTVPEVQHLLALDVKHQHVPWHALANLAWRKNTKAQG